MERTDKGEVEDEWSVPFVDSDAEGGAEEQAAGCADAGEEPSSDVAGAERAAALAASTEPMEWRHPELGYVLTTDRDRVDLDTLHQFLSTEAYWSIGISKARVALAVRFARPFSL